MLSCLWMFVNIIYMADNYQCSWSTLDLYIYIYIRTRRQSMIIAWIQIQEGSESGTRSKLFQKQDYFSLKWLGSIVARQTVVLQSRARIRRLPTPQQTANLLEGCHLGLHLAAGWTQWGATEEKITKKCQKHIKKKKISLKYQGKEDISHCKSASLSLGKITSRFDS
jgi:hypothetical protein